MPARDHLRHGCGLHLAPLRAAGQKTCCAAPGVRLATVANFPHGSDDIAGAAEECAAAAAEGADEVDVVAPIEAIREGDIGMVNELVTACRAAARETTLKVILETGVLARATPDRRRSPRGRDGRL